jgi:hypothetical protein
MRKEYLSEFFFFVLVSVARYAGIADAFIPTHVSSLWGYFVAMTAATRSASRTHAQWNAWVVCTSELIN